MAAALLRAPRPGLILPSARFRRDVVLCVDGQWYWRRYSKADPDRFQDWAIPDEASMSAVQQILMAGGYSPQSFTYNSSQLIPCPIGPRQVTFTMWGGGAGGAHNTGCSGYASGGSSGYTQFAMALTSAMWGTNIVTLSLGTPGTGHTGTTGNGTGSVASTLTSSTLTISSVTMGTAGPGTTTPTGGVGGTVTNANPGATNTAGVTGGTNTTIGPGAPNGGGNVSNAAGSTPGGGGSGGGGAVSGKNGGGGQLNTDFI